MNKTILNTGRLLSLSFIFLFLISLSSASINTNDVDDVYQINDLVRYTKSCINNGTFCAGTVQCNYTIFDPDGSSVLVNNAAATNVGTTGASLWQYNYTFLKIGVYQIDMVCIDDGAAGSRTFYAQITGSGFNDTFGFYILILALSLGVVLIGFYMEDATVTLFGSFGLYFLALYILFNGLAGVKDLTTTWAAGLIMLGLAMYFSVRSAHELITK